MLEVNLFFMKESLYQKNDNTKKHENHSGKVKKKSLFYCYFIQTNNKITHFLCEINRKSLKITKTFAKQKEFMYILFRQVKT